jgi:uncharacterized protein (DUF2236 family)
MGNPRHLPNGIADMAPESVLLAGAGRAILLQLAHPAVGHGVARHSDFIQDPMKRLHGTLMYIYALTNGTPAQAAAARAWVDTAHEPVRSPAAEGGRRPGYDARDPELQLWVAATLYDSAIAVYDAVFPPLDAGEAEEIYHQYAALGTALQVPGGMWPASRAAFARYWERASAELSVDATVRAVGRELLAARNAPRWARALMPLVRLLTTGLLPLEIRRQYGLRWSRLHDAAFTATMRLVAGVYPRLPRRLRHAPMKYYLRRLDTLAG